jgi:hypothetical protein
MLMLLLVSMRHNQTLFVAQPMRMSCGWTSPDSTKTCKHRSCNQAHMDILCWQLMVLTSPCCTSADPYSRPLAACTGATSLQCQSNVGNELCLPCLSCVCDSSCCISAVGATGRVLGLTMAFCLSYDGSWLRPSFFAAFVCLVACDLAYSCDLPHER